MDIQKAVATLRDALKDKSWYQTVMQGRGSGKHQGKLVIYVYAKKKPSEWEQVPKEWDMVAEHFPVVLVVGGKVVER